MSLQKIYADETIGITELKRSSNFINNINKPIAVLDRNKVKAYLIPEKIMADIVEYIDDIKLARIVNERIAKEWDQAVKVNIDDL